jgi:Na+-driven multidrug efflux pump
MGNIWDLFFRITTGAGAAAEIRVSLHLGDNYSSLAEISAYKSLAMGFCLATLVSLVFLALRDSVPVWYTDDEALASILRDLIPNMAVANLAMAFGMDAWSMVGAQGKYHLVTWVSFLSSCCTCIPLASVFTFVLRFDLQGLVTAVSVGCVTAGGILAYILLSSDWHAIAKAIVEKNVKEAVREENGTL